MSCLLTCKCGATCQGRVTEDDPTTNSFNAEPMFPDEWEGGDAGCTHEEYIASREDEDDSDGGNQLPPSPPAPRGTPLSELSGQPGHAGYEKFKAIARSWGYE